MAKSVRKCGRTLCTHIEITFGEHKTCSQCRAISYCSKECQTLDWKNVHKNICNTNTTSNVSNLKKFLQTKGTCKNNTKGEIIAMWAAQFFAANAKVTTEQFIFVGIDKNKMTASFTIKPESISLIKKGLLNDQITLFSQLKNNLIVYIMDQSNGAVEMIITSGVKKFEQDVLVQDVIDL